MNRPSPLLVISAVIYFAAALPLLFAPEELSKSQAFRPRSWI